MRWKRILVVIIGSVWFFPVSCTTGLFIGTSIVAKVDARYVKDGDTIHNLFTAVAIPGIDGEIFRGISLKELPEVQKQMEYVNSLAGDGEGEDEFDSISFLMPESSGEIDWRDSTLSYRVIENAGPEQFIEVREVYDDGDNAIWSRYRATASTVSPISSRMFYFGYAMAALPYAFGFAFLLYFTGRFLQRWFRAQLDSQTSDQQ